VHVRALTRPALRRGTAAVLALGMALYVADLTLRLDLGPLLDVGLYYILIVAAAVVCAARAVAIPRDRLPWALVAVGLAAWAAGDIYWEAVLKNLEEAPYPSLADAGWLAIYPTAYIAVVLLARRNTRRVAAGTWLDGAIAALGASALAAALLFEPILATATEGDAAAIATTLAYPIGDLILLGMVITVFGLNGWRPDRLWILFGAGLALTAIADSWYLHELANGGYEPGTLIDALWPGSTLLVAWAAWQPRRRSGGDGREASARVVAVPVAFALVGLALEVYDHFSRLNDVALLLASSTLAVALLRMTLAFRANALMLARSRREALTDALTGLGNRRSLMVDLEDAMEAGEGAVDALVLFDLDGFKRYNDTFGHPAGDELLRRLGHKLAAVVTGHGRAYRMGGDEFCVLLAGGNHAALVEAAAQALSEHGAGFAIGASHGAVSPAREASSAAEALQIADQRMYGHKAGRTAGRTSETRDVLMRILHAREPELHEHITHVAELAREVGKRLGLTAEALEQVARAAELHDIGKMAIPDAILTKGEPLDEHEWAFMRRHTLIGEAILSAAPALVPVAAIVRSTHERWDGAGYPDGLAREDIPLGARIVAVCDAYDAMTSDRPYRRAMSSEAALEELRRAAGTQFDPAVVAVFAEVLRPAGAVVASVAARG
jgi:two-component system cell cycle response regulator